MKTTKPTEILYVEGWPKNIPLSFDYLQSLKIAKAHYDQGNPYISGTVSNYVGPLKRKDFDALFEIFQSDQFDELNKDKEKFLERLKLALSGAQPLTKKSYKPQKIVPAPKRIPKKGLFGRLFKLYESVNQQPYEKQIAYDKNIDLQTSPCFIGELERVIEKHGMPPCAYDAHSLIIEEAKNKGEYLQIGEYLKFKEANHSGITIFLNKIPKGNIEFTLDKEKKDSYHGHYKNEYYPTNIKIDLCKKIKMVEENMTYLS